MMAGQMVGTRAWHQLLERMVELNERLFKVTDEPYSQTTPNAGASEAQLLAAEHRIGRALPAQYRELLTVADGWDNYFLHASLLGTDDIATGSRFTDAAEAITISFPEPGGDFADLLGGTERLETCLPVTWGDNDWRSNIVAFLEYPGGDWSDEVLVLGPEPPRSRDLYTCLHDEMLTNLDYVIREERGPHSPTWGRDIRLDPPPTRDILDFIRRLTARLSLVSPGPALRPGAPTAALDRLAEELGDALHPDHRELLGLADGLELVQRATTGHEIIPYLRVLSAEEILSHVHSRSPGSPAGVVPFAIGHGPVGIDPVDGGLHWPQDTVAHARRPQTTIREMLLDHLDVLYGSR